MDWLNELIGVARGFVGFLLVFLLPGLVWSLVFFKQLAGLERIALSFALSIVLVTLSILLVNRVGGVEINGINSVLIIIVVTILPVIAYYLNRAVRGQRGRFNR